MCGIAGLIDFGKQSNAEQLNKMNDSLVHRGPDGEGMYFENFHDFQIGLGHRRLAIIDLSASAAQPMHFQQLHLVYNGEIYNYAEIRNELLILGHQFTTHSDTEVILHAFAEWGIDCINKFIGMFAFVLFDENKKEIYLVRDRAGVKPLFYSYQGGLLLFGSELKALVAHSAFQKILSTDAIAMFLQYGYVPGPYCIYENTHKVLPGHYIRFDLNNRELKQTRYWNVYDAYNKPPLDISLPEAMKQTEDLLKNAFDYRMVSDVPVGVFLSGGYDSTAVTALLQKDRTDQIKTFTIGFEDQSLNEAPYAKEVAQILGTDHTEYYCTMKEALEIVPGLPYYYDEPFADSSAIPTTLVSKIAREKVTVALSADAGDEVFAGYNRYDYIMKFGKKVKQIPGFARKAIASAMDKIDAERIPVFNRKYLFHSRYEKIKQFLRQSDDYNINQLLSRQFIPDDLQTLLQSDFHSPVTAFDSRGLKEDFYSTLHYVMAIDYQTYLVDDILQKVDRATMTHSLEGREPFLDHRVVEWAAQLPLEYKYHNGEKKYILRKIVHQYVPEHLMNRPKKGFAIPIVEWLTGDLKPLAMQLFEESFIQKQSIFNYQELNKVVNDFYHGKKERAEKIWYLFMFQMWYTEWIR